MKTPSILLLTIAQIATVFGLNLSVSNTNDSGAGSLRQAILTANGSPGSVISFNIGNGVQTITPITQLPSVTAAVLIDGSTQPGFASTPLIEISGATVSNNGNGLVIDSGGGGSTIRSLVINHGWNDGILLQASNCVVTGCFIGTDPTGTVAHGNTIGIATSFGVPATGNHIGGVTAAQRNLISGNSIGVLLNEGATDNLIAGNFIGTDVTGDNALGNSVGVDLRASNNTVGGNTIALRNVIAGGPGSMGVVVQPAGSATDNRIQGNFIGTDRTGTKALGFSNGVFLSSGATNTLVGGLTTAPGTPPGNLISGNNNGGAGVEIALNVSNNSVQGNLIGTNAAGTAALANFDGVQIQGSSNLIGGNTTAAGNVISGNARHGIFFGTNNAVVQDNLIQGNFIGTKINGTELLGNAAEGIFVVESTHNTIGGTVAVAGPPGNLIAGNAGNGIGVSFGAFGVTGLTIKGNSISSNGGLGIDLGENGVTLNDAGDIDDGVNHLQNFPVLESVANSGGMTHVGGTLNSLANTTFRIEFFSSDSIDPSGYGEGENFIGFTNVTTTGSGNISFNTALPQIGAGRRVTATATDPNGNTSELSGANGQLLNISTRLNVQTGAKVLIGGFIINGSESKSILVRALGPTLAQPPFNLSGVLTDPTLALSQGGAQLDANDNWADTHQSDINATGKAPPNAAESAILRTLVPDAYTAILSGKNATTGVGLVEVYDLTPDSNSSLANISTRGFVETGSSVMIGGFIVQNGIQKIIVRGLGPTLGQPPFNVPEALADPVLAIFDANGQQIASNDNWKDTQQAEIQASGKAPPNDSESAIIITRPPGNTTAIVSGKNNNTGNALVEVYILP